MTTRRKVALGAPLALFGVSGAAYATTYFTADGVKRALFPSADRFVDATVTLTPTQMRTIAQRTRTRVRRNTLPMWWAYQRQTLLGAVIIDEVVGKHEFITYGVALDPTDGVRQIEIMDFRESYGDEVRNARWRAQFTGRHAGDTLRVGGDIQNISGATLSCVHITDGVRRVLGTVAHAVRGQ
jgi:hypothetical protein